MPRPRPSGAELITRYVEVDGLRTHYEAAGEARPIVCIHAACQDTMMYRQVVTGHYPMMENPYEFNEALRRFLDEVGVGGAAPATTWGRRIVT